MLVMLSRTEIPPRDKEGGKGVRRERGGGRKRKRKRKRAYQCK